MPDYRRRYVPGGTYFFTVNLLNRNQTLLTNHYNCLISATEKVRSRHPFETIAWVVLPDHLHCLWKLPSGDDKYSIRWSLIKSGFSRSIPRHFDVSEGRRQGERGIWQRRFWEHHIRDDEDLLNHINYIHTNPVKHGYVERPEDWRYSSIHDFKT